PQDTANRIVIASDGNETEGSVLAAAELAAANDVPIDVLVLGYEHANEVIFERIAAPSRARLGQTANIKLVLRSQGHASGRVTLRMNDEYLDLNGAEQGTALPVTLDPGLTVVPVSIGLDVAGPVQFEAVFEADDPTQDGVSRNNRAVAVTFAGAEGKILVIDDGATQSQYLVRALAESELSVEVAGTAALARGPVFLAAYDAVALANIPRYALTDDEDRTLHAYVHDLGGGLVMLGGPLSFGAGGWIDSETARVLPIKLDPPQSRQMPRGALALIMHSTEMPQGNYWGQKVAIAAIEALSRLDYVGIIDFDYRAGGCVWQFGPEEAGDKTDAINAAKKMIMGDMPDFARSMQLALNGLSPLPAGQKHVIIISDGDPRGPPQTLLDAFVQANISVTTVLVSGHGTMSDRMMMKGIAEYTGGSFYEVKNPKNLPQIFIKEAQLISRSLIVEEPGMQPQVVIRLPGPTEGFVTVPAVDGYVLTAPREGHSLIPIVNPTSEGNDPIYAYWNYGLGKAVAYMSDLTGLWGGHWVGWSEFKSFWEQSFRWVMRPSAPSNIIVNTTHEGDRAQVEVEALKGDTSFMDFLRTSAVVLQPDGNTEPLTLQQTGPGRYRGDFRTTHEGAYLVNINFVGGSPESPMQGNVQAAVSVPYPREFRAVKHNAALLKAVAERTGGRELGATDPALVDLFYRGELGVPKSPRSVWDLLAILAAALFVLDVAGRRIAVDRRAVGEFVGRAVGRRAEVGTETVAAWKRVADRRGGRSQARFEATEQEGQAFDVAAEVSQTPKVKGPARPAADAAEAEAAPDEGEYTSRLLAAKRRARDKAQGSGEDEPDA
ncbi:MAG: vWA domain-containing protein, partial [Planctomycetota bacterium]